jgi:hypothetical protein
VVRGKVCVPMLQGEMEGPEGGNRYVTQFCHFEKLYGADLGNWLGNLYVDVVPQVSVLL